MYVCMYVHLTAKEGSWRPNCHVYMHVYMYICIFDCRGRAHGVPTAYVCMHMYVCICAYMCSLGILLTHRVPVSKCCVCRRVYARKTKKFAKKKIFFAFASCRRTHTHSRGTTCIDTIRIHITSCTVPSACLVAFPISTLCISACYAYQHFHLPCYVYQHLHAMHMRACAFEAQRECSKRVHDVDVNIPATRAASVNVCVMLSQMCTHACIERWLRTCTH